MKKIPTALRRNPDDRAHVLAEVEPGCEWVFRGEGVWTRKYDGTCTMLDEDGQWWARREVKPGKEYPPNYIVEDEDLVTGKTQGWEPIEQSSFAKFHAEALTDQWGRFPVGTYELIGPKINGNPEGSEMHELVRHDDAETWDPFRGPFSVQDAMEAVRERGERGWEGIVWHHPDGRMAKLKARDISAQILEATP